MEILCHFIGFLGGAGGKYLSCQCRRCKRALGREDPLEEDTGTHSSVLAWRIPWTWSLVGYSPLDHKESDMTETA